jgi:3,4-dihydroxy 2-butanone 4-phosphate synthase / GTP cyclohydrolase II
LSKVTELKDEGFRLDPIEDVLADLRAGPHGHRHGRRGPRERGRPADGRVDGAPEDINFMARYGRGLICLTLTPERCEQLRLPLMVTGTDRARSTNFTLSIEAAEGVTTGISAHDRAHTIRTAVAPARGPRTCASPATSFP